MSQNYKIQIASNSVSAAVIGNTSNVGVLLSKELINRGVKTNFLHPHTKTKDTENLPELLKNPDFFHHDTHSCQVVKHPLNYVFYVQSSNSTSEQLNHVIQDCIQRQTKLGVVVVNHPLSQAKHQKGLEKLYSTLSQVVKQNLIDARIIHLNEVYGPNIRLSSKNISGKILKALKKKTICVAGVDESLIYPLFEKDAIQAVLKATFLSNSKAKIFEVGGEPISILNFSYKVRQNAPTDFTSVQEVLQTSSDSSLHDQIVATKQDLRWECKTTLNHGLAETIHKIVESADKEPRNSSSQPSLHSFSVPKIPPTIPVSAQSFPIKTPETRLASIQPEEPQIRPASGRAFSETQNPKTPNQAKTFTIKKINTPRKTIGTPRQIPRIKTKKIKLQIKKPSFNNRFSNHKKILASLFLGIIFIVAAIIWQISSTVMLTNRLYTNLKNVDFDSAKKVNTSLLQKTSQNLNIYSNIGWLSRLVIGEKLSENTYNLLYLNHQIALAANSSINSYESLSNLAKLVSDSEKGNIPQEIQTLKVNAQATYHQLSQIEATIKTHQNLKELQLFQVGNRLGQLEHVIARNRKFFNSAIELLNNAETLLGVESRKTYMMLLQNNAELRPTGGFIGSYALISFEKGKLLDIHVEDVYTADGQLRGHVEPPEAIKKYLGEAGWFLRDSNWDPHFPTSAGNAQWFLEKEMGQKVDGVIAINMHVIQDLLSAIGPINVIDYDETITAENLFERAQYQTEINYFDGSTKKRDFLGKLASGLITELINGDHQTWMKVGESLIKSAVNKQLLISVNDAKSQLALEGLGWTGSLRSSDCSQLTTIENCITDFIAIREANVGVNKANYFVERSVSQYVTILSDGTIETTINLNLKNNSIEDAWPGGNYKNYLRFYIPETSLVEEIFINGSKVSQANIDVDSKHAKKVVGILTQTEPQSSDNISLTYTLQEKANLNEPFAYNLLVQKQPGTGDDSFQLTIDAPRDLSVIHSKPVMSEAGLPIESELDLSTDLDYLVEFTR